VVNVDHKVDMIGAWIMNNERLSGSPLPPPPTAPLTHQERVEAYLRKAEQEGKW
jgi:hypothetical protein